MLKGIRLENKDLGMFWMVICGDSKLMSRSQFKLFCKYCAIYQKRLPFSDESFSRPQDPVNFDNSVDIQLIGRTGVEKLNAARESRIPQPQPLSSPSQIQGSNVYGYQGTPHNIPPIQEIKPPQTVVSGNQSAGSTASTPEQLAAQFVVSGSNPEKISPEDYVNIKKVVEMIAGPSQEVFTFDQLKGIILAFKLENTKEATRLWKLVDQSNNRTVTKEGKIHFTKVPYHCSTYSACQRKESRSRRLFLRCLRTT